MPTKLTYQITAPFADVNDQLAVWNMYSEKTDKPSISTAREIGDGIIEITETFRDGMTENDMLHQSENMSSEWIACVDDDECWEHIDSATLNFKHINIQ